jgi:3'(2'), 5'-bisphosphate nucleotidase
MAGKPDKAMLNEVTAIALRAGAIILEHYAKKSTARSKADRTPVTDADEAAEAAIVPALEALLPGVPVVAEEAVARSGVPRLAAARFWLVDPLDGTREFLSRNGEFTVNIALVEGALPVLGVVHAPALALTFAAFGPGTAVRKDGDGPFRAIAVRAVPCSGAVVVASRSHGDVQKLDRFLAGVAVMKTIQAGSALKFGLIASGEADLYPRFGRTMEWDTAAGHAVLLAAGGRVETMDGEPLHYGKPGFANPEFVARGKESAGP